MRSAMSLKAAVWPGHVGNRVAAPVAFGTTSSRRRLDEVVRRLVLRRRARRHEHDRDGLPLVELRLADGRDVLHALDVVVDPLRCLGVALASHDDRDRSVEAGPEALGEQVVRAPAGLLRRLRALVRGAEADERRGRGEHEADEQEDREHGACMAGHEATPAGDERLLASGLGIVDRLQERHLEPVDLVAQEPQDREQQRVRDQDGREDAERAADPELRDEVEPEEREAGHGDRDREAGEEDGPPRRGSRFGRGLAGESPSCSNCRKRVTMKSE